MTKVYLITSGQYSDYSIDAAFSTEELAEAWIGAQNDQSYYHMYRVEEFTLDRPRSEWFIQHVELDKSGKVIREWRAAADEDDTDNQMVYHRGLRVSRVGYTLERTVKVANEIRTYLLSNELWDRWMTKGTITDDGFGWSE